MKKTACLLLSLLLLLSLATLGVAAQDTDALPIEEGAWILSQDGKTLKRGEKSYEYYPLYVSDSLLCNRFFIFDMQELYHPDDDGAERTVYIDPDNEHFVFLRGYYYYDIPDLIFVDAQGKEWLDNYVRGTFGSYRLRDGNGHLANIPLDVARNFDSESANTRVFDVKELAAATCYELLGADASETLAHTHGAIYALENAFFYVNYDALDNSYFDGDGNFSYRNGSVSATQLDGATVNALIAQLAPHNISYTYESDGDALPALSPTAAKALFILFSFLLGFVLPAVPLVLGLIFSLSRKSLHPKRWHLVWVLAALWMLAALAVMLLVLL